MRHARPIGAYASEGTGSDGGGERGRESRVQGEGGGIRHRGSSISEATPSNTDLHGIPAAALVQHSLLHEVENVKQTGPHSFRRRSVRDGHMIHPPPSRPPSQCTANKQARTNRDMVADRVGNGTMSFIQDVDYSASHRPMEWFQTLPSKPTQPVVESMRRVLGSPTVLFCRRHPASCRRSPC